MALGAGLDVLKPRLGSLLGALQTGLDAGLGALEAGLALGGEVLCSLRDLRRDVCGGGRKTAQTTNGGRAGGCYGAGRGPRRRRRRRVAVGHRVARLFVLPFEDTRHW